MSAVRINILNVAAGKGLAGALKPPCGEDYYTDAVGDARRFVAARLSDGGSYCFCVYGGDGTVNEVVSGILDAAAADRATVAVIPTGTGNDFVRSFSALPAGEELPVDVITYNDHYAVNMLNIGFDCSVVASTDRMKRLPGIGGSLAYILGVVEVLLHKMGQHMRITFTDAGGQEHMYDGETLLCAVANAPFCGGGFRAAPAAQCNDGLLDMMIVHKVSRFRFAALIKYYRAGTHILPDGRVADKFKQIIEYYKCTKIKIEHLQRVCADGEIFPCETAQIGILPRAVRFVSMPE